MTLADFHTIIAELAMALAGFSGLVMGIKNTQARTWTRQDRFGLGLILTTSGLAMLFSLAPPALHMAGLTEGLAAQITHLTLAALVVLGCVTAATVSIRSRPRYPWSFWPLMTLGLVISISLIYSSFGGIGTTTNVAPLLLIWLLTVGFAQFFTFLVLTWIE